jgi:phage baseplate assembly protein W
MSIARTSEYSDLNFAFKPNPNTNDMASVKGYLSVKQSVLNILKTNHGERPFNPFFGANLSGFLFENINNVTASRIASSIKYAILNDEPRVKLLNVNVKSFPDDNAVYIKLTIQILSTSDVIDVETSLERLR